MCAYPKLIAAYHVLHRLLMPRHSPCALCSLTYAFYINKTKYLQRIFLGLLYLYKQFIYYVQFSKNKLSYLYGLSKLNRLAKTTFTVENHFDFFIYQSSFILAGFLHRKEVIQPQVLLRLPCYDFTPIADPTLGRCLLAVSSRTLGIANSHGVTGGVYKARERIHRDILIRDY